MRPLSKSKLLAFRQCPKRLWLEMHRPEACQAGAANAVRFNVGHRVGAIARQLYDPDCKGMLIDADALGYAAVLEKSKGLINTGQPIFEAAFSAAGALILSDIMLPVGSTKPPSWRIVEVKSSARLKDHHRDDAAIQSFVSRTAGVSLVEIAVATVDSKWVYPGGGDYRGLLKEDDLTQETSERAVDVERWIACAHQVAALPQEPTRGTGRHCSTPHACAFLDYCKEQEPKPDYPIDVLPRPTPGLRAYVREKRIIELADVPDELLNPLQLRVKRSTLSGDVFFDAAGAASALAAHPLPAMFLDFETTSMPVPLWAGTRPYQQIPFQFSVHLVDASGKLSHREHLDLSGDDPRASFAAALIRACGEFGPVFAYNAAFERSRIAELAVHLSELEAPLASIAARLVDLLPIARTHYYHPSQHGSWSIKAVLPSVVPELQYASLDGIKDGNMAAEAYLEAIREDTTPDRREAIRQQLLEYCALDTYAMVRLWQVFAGRLELEL